MKEYSIYIEGYATTGESNRAQRMGTAKGNTFRDAVIAFSKTPKAIGWGNFDEKSLTFWGCNVFDNLHDAQRSYG